MSAISNALVVGAGIGGCAAATFLARDGVDVDLVEIKSDVTAIGSGITVQGNALRVLRDLGVWDAVSAHGYGFSTLGMRSPAGDLLFEMDDARTGGPDLPATMGMERPVLARILVDNSTDAGVTVHYGTTVQALEQDDDGVDVTLQDGTTGRYDLVVGADGVRSHIRSLIEIDVQPQPTGMGIWRLFTTRPESVTRTDLVYHGRCFIAGYCPTGEDSMYAYLVEEAQDHSDLDAQGRLAHMRRLAEGYHGPWDDIRELMVDPDGVNYTWFETHVVPSPWYRGRVVLIGDAAHSCPPTIAQGAAQALEDATVLAEVIDGHDEVPAALDAFMDRRFDRAKVVVDSSVQLGQWLLDGEKDADVPGVMGRVFGVVSQRP